MAIFSDIFLFSFCLLDTGALVFILIYFIITLSDLECDYLNASECCGKLNFWNVPKFWAQILVSILLLIGGHWVLFSIHIPICFFLGRRFWKHPRRNIGEYDPAAIHDTGMLKKHLIGVSLHLGWQMVAFFIFLYGLLDAVMREPVIMEQDDVTVLNRPAAHGVYNTIHPQASADDEM